MELSIKKILLKNKIYLFIIIVLIVLICGSTISYLMSTDNSKSEFILSTNEIEIVEDFNPPEELLPGIVFKKEVEIKNISQMPCYVRIKAVFSNSDVGQYCELIGLNNTDYIYDPVDEYYYYKTILNGYDANKDKYSYTTKPLFEGVKVKDDAPELELEDFEIIIYAESIQAVGFNDYQEAWAEMEKNR